MNQSSMFRSAVIGGVLLGVLSSFPVIQAANCFCCAWVIAGGVVASYLYVKSSPTTVTLGQGVGLGLLTGVIGAVVSTLFAIPLHLLLGRMGMGFGDQMRQAIEQLPNLPPETKETMRSILTSGPNIGLFFIILTGIFNLFIYGLMAMVGGAIGVAIFEKRKLGGDTPNPAPPYEPPPPAPPQDLP